MFDDRRAYLNPNTLSSHDGYQDHRNLKKEYKDNLSKDTNMEVQTRRSDEMRNESSNNIKLTAEGRDSNENWRTQQRKNPQNQDRCNDETDKAVIRKNHGVQGNYQGNFSQPNLNMQHTGHQGRGTHFQNRGMQHHQQGRGYPQGNRRGSYQQGQTRPSRNREPEEGRQSNISYDPNASGERGRKKMFVKDVVEELKGDLFSAPTEYSLAHCVAKDFRMGSGIAVQFRTQFKQVAELLDQNVDIGGCAYLKDTENDRFIFYLVTKNLSNDKPSIDDLERSLETLLHKCKELGVTKLAMPRIGCGLDHLEWRDVKYRINEVFKSADIEIRVYEFNAPPNYYKRNSVRWGNYNSSIFQSKRSNEIHSDKTSYFVQDFPEYLKSQGELYCNEHDNSIKVDKSSDQIDILKCKPTKSSNLEEQYSHTQGGLKDNQETNLLTDQSYHKKTSIHHDEALIRDQDRKKSKRDRGKMPSDKSKDDSDGVFKQKQSKKKKKNKRSKKDFDVQELEGKSLKKRLNNMDAIKVNYGSSDEDVASRLGNKKVEKLKYKIKYGSMEKGVYKIDTRNEELKMPLISEHENGSSVEENNTEVEYKIKSSGYLKKKKRRKSDRRNATIKEPLTSEDRNVSYNESPPSNYMKNTELKRKIKSKYEKRKRMKMDKGIKELEVPLTKLDETGSSDEVENIKVEKLKDKLKSVSVKRRTKSDKRKKILKVPLASDDENGSSNESRRTTSDKRKKILKVPLASDDENGSSNESLFSNEVDSTKVKRKLKRGPERRRVAKTDKRDELKLKGPLIKKHKVVGSSKYKDTVDNTKFERVHDKMKHTSHLKRGRHDMDSSEESLNINTNVGYKDAQKHRCFTSIKLPTNRQGTEEIELA